MLFWSIFIVAIALGLLTALKGWAWVRGKAAKAERSSAKVASRVYSTLDSELDDWVNEANELWPSLRVMPLFWVALVTLSCMVALNFKFGWDKSNNELTLTAVVLVLLFSLADVAIAILAVRGDRGTHKWYEFERADRAYSEWMLIGSFTALSIMVVIWSTSDISNNTRARQNATQSSYAELHRQIEIKTRSRDELTKRRIDAGGLSREALEARAKEAKDAAEREALRKRCASKCEEKKAEAVKWEAQAADARQEDGLNEELAALHAKLKEAPDIRDGTDPFADLGATMGIAEANLNKWIFIGFGVVFALGNTFLWLIVGDEAGRVRAAEYARRGAIADEDLATRGKAPKYTAPQDAPLAIAPPIAGSGDTIIVNVAAEDMRKRYANDADLLEVDGLFGSLVEAMEGGSVTIAELYRAYQIAKLRKDPNGKYMTQPTMASKLSTISQHRDEIKFTSDGRILGWTLKAVSAAAAE